MKTKAGPSNGGKAKHGIVVQLKLHFEHDVAIESLETLTSRSFLPALLQVGRYNVYFIIQKMFMLHPRPSKAFSLHPQSSLSC